MEFSDVLLPIAPFTETPGTFVNAEGTHQSFYAVVKPLGETRPAWKVIRVLGNLLDIPGFAFESTQDVLVAVNAKASAAKLDNGTQATIDLSPAEGQPSTASIYQLDSLVRRSTSLQLTADARNEVTA
jgi:NADH-quinone oxidoreductase subunit G